jgi:uncharacterized protein (DUF1697 family)
VATHIALLRGINLGGRNRVAMPALRQVVESLGHTDVSTYIQSGNVLFTTRRKDRAKLAADLERAIEQELGVSSRVVVLTREELGRVVADNPHSHEENPKAVHAVFLSGKPEKELVDRVRAAEDEAAAQGSRDSATFVGTTLYLHTPDGYGKSELAKKVMRFSQPRTVFTGTARNWATVTKLLELAADEAESATE